MKNPSLRAALYARYSTDKQRTESLDDQYHVCEQVAAREGFTVVARFGDREISGGTADRAGYQSMLDAARPMPRPVSAVFSSPLIWPPWTSVDVGVGSSARSVSWST